MNIQNIKKYFKDYDLKQYMKYIFCNPMSLMTKRVIQEKPPYLYLDQESIHLKSFSAKGVIRLLNSTQAYGEGSAPSETKWRISLAGMDIIIDKDLDWNQHFDDDEDMAALHRFIWMYNELIVRLEQGCQKIKLREQVFEYIYSWINLYTTENTSNLHSEIFQTYSVSERVVNWLYSLSIVNDVQEILDNDIFQSIVEQVQYICKNLEYYGEDYTSNHLSNNGKAIYIAGSMLNIEEFKNIGRTIVIKELDRILVDGGFLREGSVHYQFLITKNYTDIYWVAKQFDDVELEMILKPYLSKMINSCLYFQMKNAKGDYQIPLIGDISPDYKPNWIIKVPQVAMMLAFKKYNFNEMESIGYHSVFLHIDVDKRSERIVTKDLEEQNIYTILKDWGKIENKDWTLFTHVNHSVYPNNLTGHFHHDTGAIVLYYKKECILCDCGRYTYKPTVRGIRDKKMEAHCGVVIDGIQPEIDMRTFYSKSFIKKYASQKPIIKLDGTSLEVLQYGFQRLKNVGEVKRNVNIKEECVEIRDIFQGKGVHDIKLYYHSDGEFQIIDNTIILKKNDQIFNIIFEKKMDSVKIIYGKDYDIDGKAAISYGNSKNICSIVCKIRIVLPCVITTKISIRR